MGEQQTILGLTQEEVLDRKEKGKINNLDILRWLMGSKSDIEK